MGELGVWLFMALIVLVGAAVYLAVLAAFLAVIAPAVAVVVGTALALYLAGNYAAAFAAVALGRPQWNVQWHPSHDGEPAYRQYFFGPALEQLWRTVRLAPQRCLQLVRGWAGWVNERFFGEPDRSSLALWPLGIAAWLTIVVAVGVATAILVALVLCHVLLILLVQALARGAIATLRLLDSLRLRIRHIRLICQFDGERVNYPRYACPNPDCDHRHDVRPGRYGVIHRRCRCGTRMPTLLLFGSHRLTAFCPDCGRQLTDRIGATAEIVLPLFGGTSVGKSKLMLMMIEALKQIEDRRISVELADDETREAVNDHRRDIADGRPMMKTQTPGRPTGRTLRLTSHGVPRHLYFYDTAGEVFLVPERVDDMVHLELARSFIFVIDPLAVPSFWDRVDGAGKRWLDPKLRSRDNPEEVYLKTTWAIQRRQVRLRKVRLAIAVSKADLIRGHQFSPPGDNQDGLRQWLVDELGLGNLVRKASHDFGEVRLFLTAAVLADGVVDRSVIALADWILVGEGLPSLRLTR